MLYTIHSIPSLQPFTLASAAQAATSSIQETQQSIAADEADLKAHSKKIGQGTGNDCIGTRL